LRRRLKPRGVSIFKLQDATHNLVTMYTTDAAALRSKVRNGEFTLLHPRSLLDRASTFRR